MRKDSQNEKSRRGLKVRHPGGSWRNAKERRAWERRSTARSFGGLTKMIGKSMLNITCIEGALQQIQKPQNRSAWRPAILHMRNA
nr:MULTISPECIES: hypothetical protein [unclassified Rhizobium]